MTAAKGGGREGGGRRTNALERWHGRDAPETMTAAIPYGSGHYPNDESGHFGRSGGRDHNATGFGTISWEERTPNEDSGHSLCRRPLPQR